MGMGTPPSARRGKRHAPMADINVTPLVDVMLVLLIIFMVTAPLLITGVPVKLPENRAKALESEEEPTVISLTAQGEIFLNDTAVDDAELSGRLADIAAAHSGQETPQIFLRADQALDYGRVMVVMGELNRVGLNRIALVSTATGDTPVSHHSPDAQ
ncbi:MAG: ExbD/TolR family protein [Sphingomonadales bacterium]|nr:MAG: ExbD/TolR family protein [Sphingomonadales bacterium]